MSQLQLLMNGITMGYADNLPIILLSVLVIIITPVIVYFGLKFIYNLLIKGGNICLL